MHEKFSTKPMSDLLAGICVLVTRPSHQADNLVDLIELQGGEALRFPTLEIQANADRDALMATIGNIADFDIAIFISINAVSHGVRYLPVDGKRPLLAAIGPSTSRALVEAGFKTDIKAKRGFTSEALLYEPALRDVTGKKIVIFRGNGGRALLGRELEQRGAEVTYAEVYRRDRPEELDPEIESRIAAGTIDVITATSAETLFSLYDLADEQSVTELVRIQLVTTSDRVVKKAAALGFEQPALLATGPDDQALVEAILNWRQTIGHVDGETEGQSNDPIDNQTDDQNDSVTRTTMTKPGQPEPDYITDAGEEVEMAVTEDHDAADTGNPNQSGQTDDESAIATEESTATETPTTKPVPAKRGSGFLSLLAILLSLAALAASAYVWWLLQQTGSATVNAQAATADTIAATQQKIATLGGRLDENLARVSGIDASRGRFESSIDDMRSSVETLTARVYGAEQSIDSVKGISASARNNWVRAEAEYYLQAANSRLQLARDPAAALAALEAADDRLKSLGSPTLYSVRQELAGEIAALRAVPRPDMEGIAHSLNGLAGRVEQLPLKNASPDSYQATEKAGEEETPSAMDRASATISRVFTSMVSIKRTDEAANPLLSGDEEFFLKRNLELQLQTARLALLRGEPANYTESLRTARNWLQTHFKTEAASVQSALRSLTELEKENIAPGLPDISGSLRLLRLSAPPDVTTPTRPATNNLTPTQPGPVPVVPTAGDTTETTSTEDTR